MTENQIKTLDHFEAEQITVGVNTHTDRFALSILEGFALGDRWHQVRLTRRQMERLAENITAMLAYEGIEEVA